MLEGRNVPEEGDWCGKGNGRTTGAEREQKASGLGRGKGSTLGSS